MALFSAFHISLPRFAHLFGNDAVSSRASGLHRGGRGQRPRQTLQAARGPERRAPPGASRVFSSRNYSRQVTAPSSPFYGTVDERVAKNLFARKKNLPEIRGTIIQSETKIQAMMPQTLFGHRHFSSLKSFSIFMMYQLKYSCQYKKKVGKYRKKYNTLYK